MRYILIAAASLLVACGTHESPATDSLALPRDSIRVDLAANTRQDSIDRAAPGYVIDSLLPPEEEARRFRAAYRGESCCSRWMRPRV